MPVDVTLQHSGSMIVITGRGVVTDEEYVRAHTIVEGTEDKIRRLRGALSDWTEVEDVEVSAAAVRQVAARNRRAAELLPQRFPVALVVARDSIYGLSRMWEAYAQDTGWETRLFRDRQPALHWLRTRMEASSSERAG